MQQPVLGTCHSCGKPIQGKVVKALGHDWHPEHFACMKCKAAIEGNSFMEKDGQPVCKKCWDQHFADKCNECGKPIGEKTIMALGGKYHPECFKCQKCKKPITEEQFQIENGKPLCSKCAGIK